MTDYVRYPKELRLQLKREAAAVKAFEKREAARQQKILESAVKKAVKERLETIGAYQHWPVQSGYGKRTLDCIGCLQGLYFAVETKKPGEVPTLRQNTTIAEINAAGGLTFVIDTVEKARALFDDRFPFDWTATRSL